MPSSSASAPLFVVGVWRSGTSLLYALLNQHPQIALMYEGELLTLWPLFRIPGVRSRWPARWDFWNSALTRHQIEPASIPSGLTNVKTATEAVYQEYARRRSATVWGEKSPNYFDSLNRLAGLFPGARFILIWRNPVSICRSVVRAAEEDGWFAKKGMVNRALLGCKRMKVQCDRLVARGIPVHQINYEELTGNTAEVMTGVCNFLGVPFHARMKSLDGADRSAVYEGEHHALVKGERVVAAGWRPEALSSELQSKIERYVSLWRQQYDGEWPAFPKPSNGSTGKPSLAERCFDEVRYRGLRGFDFGVRLTYSIAPLWLWKAYRGLKRPAAIPSTKTKTPSLP